MRTYPLLFAVAMLACSTSSRADDAVPTRESVVVRHDSPGKRAGGIVLTSIGGLFFTGGAALSIGAGVGIAGGRGDVTSAIALILGGAGMLVGLSMGVPGILLIATSGEKKAQPIDEAKLGPPPMPRSYTLPLFSGTF